MACTFPTYTDITGAEILGVLLTSANIGRYNEASINAENSSEVSIIGRAVTYFNTLATNAEVDISGLSDDLCAKLRMSLRWYIVGKYRENDLELEGCPDCYHTDELVCLAYANACKFMKLVDTDMSTASTFCTWKDTEYALTSFFGVSGFKPCGCDE